MIYPAQHQVMDLYAPTASESAYKPPAPARRLSIGPKSLCDAIEVRPEGLDWQLLTRGRPIVGDFPANSPIQVRAPRSFRPRGAAGGSLVNHFAEIEIDDFAGSELVRPRGPFFWSTGLITTAGAGTFNANVGRVSGRRRIYVTFRGSIIAAVNISCALATGESTYDEVFSVTGAATPVYVAPVRQGWVIEDPADVIVVGVVAGGVITYEFNVWAED